MSRRNREQVAFEESVSQTGHLSTREHKVLYPKTYNQRLYLESLNRNIITIATGCAGTGKTLLALYQGFRLMAAGKIERIVYIKPNVGLYEEREVGFLPGTKQEKMVPLTGPILDNLVKFMPVRQAEYHIEHTIECMLLADIRGRSFAKSMMILDEAQNTTPRAVKTFLTRIGQDSRIALIGDSSQCDLQPGKFVDGLGYVVQRLRNQEDVDIVHFVEGDIIRHPIIAHILARLD